MTPMNNLNRYTLQTKTSVTHRKERAAPQFNRYTFRRLQTAAPCGGGHGIGLAECLRKLLPTFVRRVRGLASESAEVERLHRVHFLALLELLGGFLLRWHGFSPCFGLPPHGRSHGYRQIRGHMSSPTRPQFIPCGMRRMQWPDSFGARSRDRQRC
jgi:hypothetical protein